MATHTIRIRLDGSTVIEEDFPGGTVKLAEELARARYPMAQKVWWVGGNGLNKEETAKLRAQEAANRERVRQHTDWVYGNHEQPAIGETVTAGVANVAGGAANAAASAGGFGIMVGGLVVVGTVILTFPLIVGGFTAALAGKVAKATIKPNTALALAIAAGTFAGGTYGGFVLQREYMPDVAAGQAEMVQSVVNAVQGK